MNQSSFSKKKILITGASGFIGSHLCRRLITSSAEVHCISRNKRNAENGLCWWQGDLAENEIARKLVNTIRPHLIFHLATCGLGGRDVELVLPTLKDGLITTVNLLNAATEIGIERFILPSSLEEPDCENGDNTPSSPYAAAKWASSVYARMFNRLYNTPVVLPRVFMTYGPGQPSNKILPYVINSLLKGESPKLSSGQRAVDWIYVDDVVDGLLAAAEAENLIGKIFDLGSGELVTIKTIVNKLVNLINPEIMPLFGALPDRPFEQIRCADISRTNSLLGWRPAVPLEEGLRRTVSSYKKLSERAGSATELT